ncbi:MAG: STAS/SEC14 domain-containing protein [Myxococcales bacterium]|nr:STAS/SEC14 domain-containing protein [Myxococcales bacterium]
MGFYSIRPDRLANGRPLVKLILRGTMDRDEAHEMITQLRAALAAVIGDESCALLIDHREQETLTAGARKALADEVNDPLYWRIAFLGGSVFIRTVSRFILRASGQTHKARFFSDVQEALQWLQEG